MDAFQVDLGPLGGEPRPRRRRLRRTGVAVAAVAIGAGALVVAGTIRPDGGPAEHRDRIAFVDESGALSTIGARGSGTRTYVVDGAGFRFPAWSPDGTKIAAIGGDAAEGGIYVFDDVAAPAAGAAPEPVVLYPRSPAYPIYLFWSPDGERIAFITSEAGGLALQVVSADGTGSPVVIRRGSPMYWDWVDEAHLLVHSGADGPDAFVGEVGLDAPQATAVSSSPGQFQAPGVSPTGGDRAYAVAPAPDGRRVVVEGADGSIRASAPVDGPTAIGWSPAGDRLAYITPVPASVVPVGRLDVMDARTGSTRTLLDGFVVAFFWAPDARTIAVIRLADASVETASVEPVATPGRGIRLTFVDAATGAVRSDREVRLPPLIIAQFVPFFDQYALSHRLWSATGEALVLPLVDDAGESRVTIIPADGSPPARLADGVAAFWSP